MSTLSPRLVLPIDRTRIVARRLLTVIRRNPKGATIDPRTLIARTSQSWGHEDFLVSLPDGVEVDDAALTLDDVERFLEDNHLRLFHWDTFIGTWVEKGRLFLDVTERIEGRTKALNAGRARFQKAIYHPSSGTTIYL